MANKIELNNVSAIYDEKLNKVVLISKDNRFKNKGFRIILNNNSPESNILKEALAQENKAHTMKHLLVPDVEREEYVVPLGVTDEEKEVYWDLREFNVLLLQGNPCSGVSVLFNMVQEYLFDWYGEYSCFWNDSYNMKEDGALELLSKASKEIHERMIYKQLKPDADFDNLFYLIDEFDRAYIKYPEACEFLLNTIQKHGKTLGVNVVLKVGNNFETSLENTVHVGVGYPHTHAVGFGNLRLSDRRNTVFNQYVSKQSYEETLARKLQHIAEQDKKNSKFS